MIEKLKTLEDDEIDMSVGAVNTRFADTELVRKINELIGAVNKLETMAKNTNTVLESLVQENNIHEKQIDELQMKLEPEKCETRSENVQDKFAEQRKWIGKLCRFWTADEPAGNYYISLLKQIDDDDIPFVDDNWVCWEHCEPVKPTDSIIYKGE